MMTSLTTLLALMALLVFGGPVIRGFTIAMIWGVVIGTYSTVYIATPGAPEPPPRSAAPAARRPDGSGAGGATGLRTEGSGAASRRSRWRSPGRPGGPAAHPGPSRRRLHHRRRAPRGLGACAAGSHVGLVSARAVRRDHREPGSDHRGRGERRDPGPRARRWFGHRQRICARRCGPTVSSPKPWTRGRRAAPSTSCSPRTGGSRPR